MNSFIAMPLSATTLSSIDMENLRDRLAYWDFQLKIVLNPLNWSIGYTKYCPGVRGINFGPLHVFLYTGDK